MSKATIDRLFIGGAIAVTAGAIVATIAIWLAVANDVFIMAGPDIVGIQGSALAWTLLGVGLAGALVVAAGAIGGFVSWIGALLSTWRLESRTWFAVLLLCGIFNLGFFAMIAYVIAGPGDTTKARQPKSPASAVA